MYNDSYLLIYFDLFHVLVSVLEKVSLKQKYRRTEITQKEELRATHHRRKSEIRREEDKDV